MQQAIWAAMHGGQPAELLIFADNTKFHTFQFQWDTRAQERWKQKMLPPLSQFYMNRLLPCLVQRDPGLLEGFVVDVGTAIDVATNATQTPSLKVGKKVVVTKSNKVGTVKSLNKSLNSVQIEYEGDSAQRASSVKFEYVAVLPTDGEMIPPTAPGQNVIAVHDRIKKRGVVDDIGW